MPGATFVNLQYDSDLEEVANAAREFGARIISDPEIDAGGDLDDYAAQVAAMDLVISTSSASAHMGGALNVPTWVFVPLGIGGLWHWFTDREDSPWYPSVRLFRQSTRGEWGDVIERASTALDAFMQSWSAK
jgi:ADP-heptose:LPS heptosyltransferase